MEYDLEGLDLLDSGKALDSDYLKPAYIQNDCHLAMSNYLGAGWHDIQKSVKQPEGGRVKKKPMSALLSRTQTEEKASRADHGSGEQTNVQKNKKDDKQDEKKKATKKERAGHSALACTFRALYFCLFTCHLMGSDSALPGCGNEPTHVFLQVAAHTFSSLLTFMHNRP